MATTLLTRLALNPALTASLLCLLTARPRTTLQTRLTTLVPPLRNPRTHARLARALKWLLALGLAARANRVLNALALNNYRLRAATARWAWDKEVAVVTGGCSGIGALVVARLAARGVRVAVLDVQGLPAGMADDPRITYFACDITNADAVGAAASHIRATLGAPSVLVNNAGILSAHTILATSQEDLRRVFAVNVLSNWTTAQAFLPDMIAADKGHVATVASTASYVGVAGMADYTASKAAVLSFHEGLTQELRLSYNAPNVLTTSIHPNWVRTPLLAPVEAELKKRAAIVMEPEDVADAIAKQVFECRGAQVFLPASAGRTSLIRALPNWMQERIRLGVSKTLTDSVKIGGM
ncbi:hypothetical protein C7974DRAFT_301908 [Boeremia exigua]|uniref:uncharacterized protein n=1 Tax=Boeremia exigua TaxID=749465 RepID=UPI001E8E2D1C|nr:uncharacterized protein C7974DRAFT_301908 [Boeremia exigua]KAH6642453.1 hypothetical protein C7974DRAFT_301908 [Boeremia exigua]